MYANIVAINAQKINSDKAIMALSHADFIGKQLSILILWRQILE
jgi:hypothetical protein